MTELERYVYRAGRSERRVRDHDLACGRDPVFRDPDLAWDAFSTAVLKAPTDALRDAYMAGWGDTDAKPEHDGFLTRV